MKIIPCIRCLNPVKFTKSGKGTCCGETYTKVKAADKE